MRFHFRLFSFFVLTVLAGCGGGSGGSSTGGSSTGGGDQTPPSNNSGNDWLQFTPSPIVLTAYEGRTLDFSITAKSSKTIAQSFNIGIIDPNGIILPQVKISANSVTEYQAAMTVSDKLTAGPHSGKLEVRLCEDDPVKCAKPIQGSPWFVPITVTVSPATNLTALTAQPGLGRWTTMGDYKANIGYVPLRLDPAKFSQRWASSYLPAEKLLTTRMPMLQDGVAFTVLFKGGPSGGVNALRAIDEASGKVLWESQIPDSACNATAPALAAGKVFVGASNCAYLNGTLQAYDQKTGKLLYSVQVTSAEDVAAPLANSDALFVQGRSDIGTGRSVTRIDPATGSVMWRTQFDWIETWAADSQFLYLFHGTNMSILNQSNGIAEVQASPMASCPSVAMPMLGAQGQMYLGCSSSGYPQLLAYDTRAKKNIWTASVAPLRSVLAGSTLYSIIDGVVEARNIADGKALWSITPQDASTSALGNLASLLATDNLLFVSGEKGVAAIDMSTHKVVWTFPQGGPMAISANGVLYLPGAVGIYFNNIFPALVAVNLL